MFSALLVVITMSGNFYTFSLIPEEKNRFPTKNVCYSVMNNVIHGIIQNNSQAIANDITRSLPRGERVKKIFLDCYARHMVLDDTPYTEDDIKSA